MPHFNLGRCLVRQERLNEAIDAFRRMIELSQDNRDLVDAYNELGIVLQRQEKWTESEEAYRRAIAIDGNVAKSHHNLGSCLFRQERLEEALGEFQRARDLDPDDLKFRTACEKLRALLHERKQE